MAALVLDALCRVTFGDYYRSKKPYTHSVHPAQRVLNGGGGGCRNSFRVVAGSSTPTWHEKLPDECSYGIVVSLREPVMSSKQKLVEPVGLLERQARLRRAGSLLTGTANKTTRQPMK